MTGAVMPYGADTAVVQEVCSAGNGSVCVPPGQKAGQNVRAAGEDLKAGVAVLAPGQLLRAAELGLIASLGIGEVSVVRRLRVAFFSTGDELASIGKPLAQGQVSTPTAIPALIWPASRGDHRRACARDRPADPAFPKALRKADAILPPPSSRWRIRFLKQLMAKLGECFSDVAMPPAGPWPSQIGDRPVRLREILWRSW